MFSAVHDDHNNALKFRIIRDSEVGTRVERFRGAKWDLPEFEGHRVQKTRNWLIIYNNGRNRVPLKDLENTADTILKGMVDTAVRISQRYNFEIDTTPLPFSSNRPEIKTPYLSSVNFIEKEAKAVYPIPSPIELVGENAVANSWNLTQTLANLTRLTELEIENKKRHQAVLESMETTLKAIESKCARKSLWQNITALLGCSRE